jgi:hypothetical protein
VDFEYEGGAPTFSVFGTIELAGGEPVEGVFLTLNPGSKFAVTDSSGNYSFSGLGAGNYSLTPTLGLYTFAPTEREFEITNASVNNQDFTATEPPPTFQVSGNVQWTDEAITYGVPHVDVVLSKTDNGPVFKLAETDASGTFFIFDVPNGLYFMRVSAFGYNPAQTTVTVQNSAIAKNIQTALLDGPTWENFAASYVGNHCVQCHRPDSQTAVDPPLRTYSEVVDAGTASNARIQNNTMPPEGNNLAINQRYFQLWRLASFPED